MAVLTPLSALGMLTVPGITFDMIGSLSDLSQGIAGIIGMGLWNWYAA